ncbi:DeoR/GlpR family DNA-binding transcription regulator [Xylocopilactobacillus apicola]|uniref:DeoR family transcriptional regulator n=1 Tax=Xylocopilactobacillus apicola TaxID=2932184 RepID=A0AAU9DUL7_9LACO|nr:DeoR/GlpR family DNA-binding transcription regulator [Xylocopilactobacillus apicola]BDR59183.1 DeoR family transcriptional regulator [Xylocopilactobacillus apicola]
MKAIEIQQRRQKILTLLSEQHQLSVQKLTEILDVSDETIRKDLKVLVDQGMIKKSYGTAEIVSASPLPPVSHRDKTENPAKSAIAATALTLITPTMRSIGLDQGSTVAKLAARINDLHHKTVITRSLPALIELKDGDNEFFSPGGYYNYNDMSFQNIENPALPNIQLDISFFGSSGVKNSEGLCSSSFTDAAFKKQMNDQSTVSIALLDHTKFTQTSLVTALPWTKFDTLITDHKTPQEIVKQLQNDVKVIVAD